MIGAVSTLGGCSDDGVDDGAGPNPSASAHDDKLTKPAMAPKALPREYDANPLELPPVTPALAQEMRVFAPAHRMLSGAGWGTTIVLYAATAVGVEGSEIVVEGTDGPDYRVHAGLVLAVPDGARPRPREAIMTEWAGVFTHAAFIKYDKKRPIVRLTDGGRRPLDRMLPERARIIVQKEGLSPGNYALLRGEAGAPAQHVMLLSRHEGSTEPFWVALGYAGAMVRAPESRLVAVPIDFSPRTGDEVWAAWLGSVRPATVESETAPGAFTVQFRRAGGATRTAWGHVMPALEGVRIEADPEPSGPPEEAGP